MNNFKKYFILLVILISSGVQAQLETVNWYFGQYMGLRFEGNQAIPVEGGQLYTGEGCASISDKQGNLQFYTDGTTVYNRNHQVMLNGTNLKGNSSSTQSAIVVPYPENDKKYIIFTVGADDSATPEFTRNQGLNYYLVDMQLEGGLGAVIHPTNNNLLPLVSEKIAAVRHRNLKDFWVVSHYGDQFYSYLVTSSGVNHNPILSRVGPNIDVRTYPVNARGYLKISPNGKTLGIAHLSNLNYDSIPFGNMTPTDNYYPTNGPYANSFPGYLGLYRFDNSTGVVSDETVLDNSGSPYGIEFSSNNENFYANVDYHTIDEDNIGEWHHGELMVFKNLLNNPNYSGGAEPIKATKRILRNYTELDTPSYLFAARGALQLAVNKRIYYSRDYMDHLSHLVDPDNYENPQFEEIGVMFPYYTYNVNTRYGLPPFFSSGAYYIQSVPLGGLSSICLGNGVQFSFYEEEEMTITSYLWNFGDGTTSTEAAPIHFYTSAGTYNVQLTVNTVEFGTLEVHYVAVVYENPQVSPAELLMCDSDQDGKIIFDLTEANNQISEEIFSYKYYKTEQDAIDDVNEIPSVYESSMNNEVIWVRVSSAELCSTITTITLKHSTNTFHQLQPEFVCVDDLPITVNLSSYNNRIEELLNLSSILNITYFASISDLDGNRNPLTIISVFDQEVKVYAKVKVFGAVCDHVVELTFKPSIIPNYTIPDALKCANESVLITAPNGYTYQWQGLTGVDLEQSLNENTIAVINPGTYTLILTNENGCEKSISFTVSDYPPIEIIDVKVLDNNQIIIEANGEGLQYSLDGVNWQYENVFVNLQPGVYTVYVKSGNNCVVTYENVVIFLWVNFLSPNSDAMNDVWKLDGLELYTNVEVQIYNRYGKILVDKTMNNENVVWDGKYNLKLQPSDSYWYIIKIPNHSTFTGSVLLKNKK
ncbi:T9SS type B sorting domain-containing protein [Faecalibacter bovis]|uniref:T9SS type B sorting domain-containing protein n=1 Tax=Faecalibacter bovis TaxID=2898187 RepID=A0ABX7XA79_9FLAO|nr:T9SS type B sorting domain-containing protein [Faecalibacter bovis]QTV04797.1 T9SS type B sorting domain-containing protein [Faecalibacter bovis]